MWVGVVAFVLLLSITILVLLLLEHSNLAVVVMMTMFLGVPAFFVLQERFGARSPPNACPNCNYSLIGLPAGSACPECGGGKAAGSPKP